MGDEPIVNRVSNSPLVTLELEKLIPRETYAELDLRDFLFQGIILKEKEFRQALKDLDLDIYRGKVACVYCSADAIVPMWAYMLMGATLGPVARAVVFGTSSEARESRILEVIQGMDAGEWEDKKVVVKGCSGEDVPPSVYLALSEKLVPVVQSLMFGEPCSTVPVYKRPRS